MGENLQKMHERCNLFLEFYEQFISGNEYITYPTIGYIRNLQNRMSELFNISYENFDETEIKTIKNKTVLYSYYMQKCHLYLLFGKYDEAFEKYRDFNRVRKF